MYSKLLLLLTLSLGLMGGASAQKGSWSEAKLQKLYTSFLEDEGMEYNIDSDGDVQFTYKEFNYFIEVSEDDTDFFRVVMFNVWPIESIEESMQVAQACSAVNRKYKCLKVYPTKSDNVWIAVELFLGSPDDFKEVFWRCMKVIQDGTKGFVKEMTGN